MTAPRPGAKPYRPDVRYSDEIATEICQRLACGESLKGICKDDHMPDKRAVNYWLFDGAHPEFEAKYRFARECQAEGNAEEIVEIADGGAPIEITGEDAMTRLHRDKVRISVRQWNAEKLLWKRYGARQQVEHSGAVETKREFIDPRLLGAEQRDELRRLLMSVLEAPAIEGDYSVAE